MIRAIAVLAFSAMLLPNLSIAQAAPARPFHDGPVWDITFVKAKPGVALKYMEYLATDWKTEHEALKEGRADSQLHGHLHRVAQPDGFRLNADDRIQGLGDHGSQPGQRGGRIQPGLKQ